MKLCVVDIGTNSIHVIYAKVEASGYYEIIGSDKEMVQLGEQTMLTGILPAESMAAAIECLKRYKYFAHRRGVDDIIVVATSAVREAKNAQDFVKQVRLETKLKVHIIDGQEEARLIALAVQSTMALGEHKSLIFDIGGGSTECIVADQQNIFWLDSLPLGSNRLKQMFPLSEPPKPKELQNLEQHVEDILKPVIKKLVAEKITNAIGTSGTINAVAKMLSVSENGEVQSLLASQIEIDVKKIPDLYKKLAQMTSDDRKKVKGLNKKRVSMIVQGMCIVKTLVEQTGIKQFVSCDKALREGILFDHLQRNKKVLTRIADSVDLRRRSVYGLLEKYNANLLHAEQTAKLTLQLFDVIAPTGKLNPKDSEILEYAALLHDIGYHISFSKHHRHTHYLILNSDMDGFAAEEIETMAWVARFHRREINRKNPEFLKFSEGQQNHILSLAACLRLADGFDSSHFAVVEALQVRLKGDKILIGFKACDDAKWELMEAQKRVDLFEKMFGKTVEFVGAA